MLSETWEKDNEPNGKMASSEYVLCLLQPTAGDFLGRCSGTGYKASSRNKRVPKEGSPWS